MKYLKNVYCAFLVTGACLAGADSALATGQEVITAATGGEAIPAETAGGAWTALTGPGIDETKARDTGGPGLGTIVLTAPQGFEFNPKADVRVVLEADGHKTINQMPDGSLIPIQVTSTTITITITSTSRGGARWPDTLTYQGIQARPTATSPLASGYITESGTCDFRNLALTMGTWGFLREVGGSSAGYVINGSNSGTAGLPETIVIQRVDQFGNPLPGSSTETLVFSGPGANGSYIPTVNGSTDAFTGGIPVVFDANGTATVTLVDYRAETFTLEVSDGSRLPSDAVGGGLPIAVTPGPASVLVFTSPPVEVTYGSTFDLALQTTDAYGNPSSSGLGAQALVSLNVTDGTGNLIGTVTQDIGTAAGNGSAQFTDLQIDAAGTHTVVVTAAGLTAGSTVVTVNPAPITVSAVAESKVYDGTTLSFARPVLSSGSLAAGDLPAFTQSFDSKEVGSNKVLTPSGAVNDRNGGLNYIVRFETAWGSITPRLLTITAVADSKTYDGTTGASVSLSDDRLPGDNLTLSYGSATFSTSSAGSANSVLVTGITATGPDAGNYRFETSLTTATAAEILKAPLTVSADDKTRAYGLENPAFTGTINGLCSGDHITASYCTEARAISLAGTYPIVPALNDPDNKLANYNVSLTSGTLTITQARATVALVSSENPTLKGSNITFAVTVAPVAPVASTPSGAVLFLADGQALGEPVALSAGTASFSTAQFHLWTNVITAAYLGDSNFMRSTNSLEQVARPPLERPRVIRIVDNHDGTVTVTCHGTPAVEHFTEASATPGVPDSWVRVSTNTAGLWDGNWSITEQKGANQLRFYRAAKPY
jgi:MBG domain (YGX type)/Bacterial Ig-like domain (group 3)/YDG domain